jgi:hypothetical protein
VKADPEAGNFKNGYLDHQMDVIKNLLLPKVGDIAAADNEMAKLSYVMFDILK